MMKVIQKADSVFGNLVGFDEPESDVQYHPSVFVIREEVEDGILLFHTLTRELLLVDGQPDDDYLRSHLFFVPGTMDEKQLVHQYRTLRKTMDKKKPLETITRYTILTTTDCNARCFYCYEAGRSRIPMSAQTAMKVVSLIHNNYAKLPSNSKKDVNIGWFGGEPLYNSKVIDLICSEMEKRRIPFKSSMISNGYLFDEDMVKKAKESWQLNSVQITLDGTENIYNRTKAFIYDDPSPYRRVVRNIGMLLDAGIEVQARLNIGLHNADDLFALVRLLADLYGDCKGLVCYAHPLFEAAAGSNNAILSADSRRQVYERLQQLELLINELFVNSKDRNGLAREIPLHYCMADNGSSIVIVPTGEIGLCEQHSDSNFISTVDAPEVIDEAMVARHAERREDIDLCENCPIYPQCIRLKMCKESTLCVPEIIQWEVGKIRRAMVQAYHHSS